jgi:hypothetical protein
MRLDDGWFQIAGVGRWNQRILAFVCFFASRGYGSEPTVCLDAGEARRDETITGGTWLAKSGGLVDSDIHLQLEVLTSLTRLHGLHQHAVYGYIGDHLNNSIIDP